MSTFIRLLHLQTPSRDDDIIVKLPVTIVFGREEDWSEEERRRMVGDGDVFGKTGAAEAEDSPPGDGGDGGGDEAAPDDADLEESSEPNMSTDVGDVDDDDGEAEDAGMEDQAEEDDMVDMD